MSCDHDLGQRFERTRVEEVPLGEPMAQIERIDGAYLLTLPKRGSYFQVRVGNYSDAVDFVASAFASREPGSHVHIGLRGFNAMEFQNLTVWKTGSLS